MKKVRSFSHGCEEVGSGFESRFVSTSSLSSTSEGQGVDNESSLLSAQTKSSSPHPPSPGPFHRSISREGLGAAGATFVSDTSNFTKFADRPKRNNSGERTREGVKLGGPVSPRDNRQVLRTYTTGTIHLTYEGGTQAPFRPRSPVDDIVSPRTVLRRKSKEQYLEFKRSVDSSSSSSQSTIDRLVGTDDEERGRRLSLLRPHIRSLLSRSIASNPWRGQLIVGTSSVCRKDVLSVLQSHGDSWHVCKFLSPNIDEKAVGVRSPGSSSSGSGSNSRGGSSSPGSSSSSSSPMSSRSRGSPGRISSASHAIPAEELSRLGALPLAVARAKAEAIEAVIKLEARQGSLEEYTRECVFLTCDQVIHYRGELREKPETAEQAFDFLRSYSYDSVSVINALVLTHYPSLLQVSNLDSATVHWQHIPEALIAQTVAKGAVMHAAGGFTIEDPLLYRLVDRIEGGIDSILGLSVTALQQSMLSLCAKIARFEGEAD